MLDYTIHAATEVVSRNCQTHLGKNRNVRSVHLDRIATRTVTLDQLPGACADLIAGTVTGRILVQVRP